MLLLGCEANDAAPAPEFTKAEGPFKTFNELRAGVEKVMNHTQRTMLLSPGNHYTVGDRHYDPETYRTLLTVASSLLHEPSNIDGIDKAARALILSALTGKEKE